MKVALYARVSSDTQAQRNTIGSQLEALQARMVELGHEVVAVYTDDGYSGARLDRPGLDALRDAAIADAFEAVWCLSPDRLARSFAYQVLVTDELARLAVQVCFTDTPAIDDDPQARLLVQVQGLFAEYERAKLSERVRRGKLYRVRSGEAVFPRVAYGYRHVPRTAAGPAHLEIYQPEAAVVRRIFDEYASGTSMRQIVRHLYQDGVASPDGKELWPVATIAHLLRNPAYAGTAAWYRYNYVPAPELKRSRKVRRPPQDWVEVPVPAIVTAEVFAAAQAIVTDNSHFSRRNTPPDTFLLRGLVVCGRCGVHLFCDNKRSSRTDTDKRTRYYGCPNHDPIKAGGPQRRCTERLIRADELDAFVFEQIRAALLRPQLLLAGEAALADRDALPDDELLAAQLQRTDRQIQAAQAERRRLADLYQAELITLPELQRRAKEITARRQQLEAQQTELQTRHRDIAGANRLRRRIANFAARVADGLEQLDFDGRQRLLRHVVEQVRVTGWQVEIRLRVPLDDEPPDGGSRRRRTPQSPTPAPKSRRQRPNANRLSSHDRLRSTNQATGHAVGQAHHHGAALLAQRTARRTRRCRVPFQPRRPAQPRRRTTPRRQTRRNRRSPHPRQQANHASRHAPQLRHGHAASRHRRRGPGAVARSRETGIRQRLHPRRPHAQAASPRSSRPHPKLDPAATSLPTSSSPSSRASNNAAYTTPLSARKVPSSNARCHPRVPRRGITGRTALSLKVPRMDAPRALAPSKRLAMRTPVVAAQPPATKATTT